MWSDGILEIAVKGSDKRVKAVYQVKHYEMGSRFGIRGGQVSKLWIEIDGKCAVSYDRGWDTRPDRKNPVVMDAYRAILKQYN